MYQDYKDLLSAFHAHSVRYLIVGGYAVIFHAQPRYTKDLVKPVGRIHGSGSSTIYKLRGSRRGRRPRAGGPAPQGLMALCKMHAPRPSGGFQKPILMAIPTCPACV